MDESIEDKRILLVELSNSLNEDGEAQSFIFYEDFRYKTTSWTNDRSYWRLNNGFAEWRHSPANLWQTFNHINPQKVAEKLEMELAINAALGHQ